MTTYTQAEREALIANLAHGQKYNISNGELLDMSYVMSNAADVITSLSDELEKLRAAPSTSQPLTPHEIGAFVGTHEFGPEQLKWFRFGEAAHGIKGGA